MPETCGDYAEIGDDAYSCERPRDDEHGVHWESGNTEEWKGAHRSGRVVHWSMTWTYSGGVVDADGV